MIQAQYEATESQPRVMYKAHPESWRHEGLILEPRKLTLTTKAHPGASEVHPVAMKDHPGASEAHPVAMKAHLGASKSHPGAVEARPGVVEAHPGVVEAHPGAVEAHPGVVEAHPGAVEARPGVVEAHPGAWRLTLELGSHGGSELEHWILMWDSSHQPWRLSLEQ